MIYILGKIAFVLLLAYALLLFLKVALQKEVAKPNSVIKLGNMPILRPVPIATVNQKGFLNKLLVLIFSVRKWRVEEAFIFEFNGKRYAISAGFIFDGASIPKILWAIISPVGLLLVPGLIHDYGYRYNGIYVLDEDGNPVWDDSLTTQKEWDQLFSQIGNEVNRMPILNALAGAGLWLGGFKAWNTWRDKKEPQEPFKWNLDDDAVVINEDTEVNTAAEESEVADGGADDIAAKQREASEDAEQDDAKATIQEAGDESDFESGTTKTTQIGYVNANNQKVHGTRKVAGTDNNQVAYKVECLACGEIYGANGSELYRRKCPKCQGGKEGIAF
ncbi:DUF1353 domain-containing protein [Thalassotalea fusca]